MTHVVQSVNDTPVRLTDERWRHIVETHNEVVGHLLDVLNTLFDPDWGLQGKADELLEVKFGSKQKLSWWCTRNHNRTTVMFSQRNSLRRSQN